ncbi:MAG: Membrane protein [Bacteroidota bacterium]|jgi:uncharacterized membrane protein YgdD (TMEM256/DUF423 family)|nr:Membrane protein [Bacteroidota bacterium]
MKLHKLIPIGLLGALAVALGALGAHFLKGKLSSGLITTDLLNGFDTAVRYQIYHVVSMFGLFLFSQHSNNKFISWAFNCFLIGIILFSGSLYFLCTRHLLGADWLKILGPVTPIGGLFFVAGWVFIALIGFQKRNTSH